MNDLTIWTVIKRFVMGWAVTGVMLVVISCVRYGDYIMTAFSNMTMAWISTVVPTVIIAAVMVSLVRAVLFG